MNNHEWFLERAQGPVPVVEAYVLSISHQRLAIRLPEDQSAVSSLPSLALVGRLSCQLSHSTFLVISCEAP